MYTADVQVLRVRSAMNHELSVTEENTIEQFLFCLLYAKDCDTDYNMKTFDTKDICNAMLLSERLRENRLLSVIIFAKRVNTNLLMV